MTDQRLHVSHVREMSDPDDGLCTCGRGQHPAKKWYVNYSSRVHWIEDLGGVRRPTQSWMNDYFRECSCRRFAQRNADLSVAETHGVAPRATATEGRLLQRAGDQNSTVTRVASQIFRDLHVDNDPAGVAGRGCMHEMHDSVFGGAHRQPDMRGRVKTASIS
jgi:hypothetical protein